MIELEFKEEDWGILHTMERVCWTNLSCPSCNKYNSQSFTWAFEDNRTEYVGNPCHHCGEQLRIKIPLETNNAILKAFGKTRHKIENRLEKAQMTFLDFTRQ